MEDILYILVIEKFDGGNGRSIKILKIFNKKLVVKIWRQQLLKKNFIVSRKHIGIISNIKF